MNCPLLSVSSIHIHTTPATHPWTRPAFSCPSSPPTNNSLKSFIMVNNSPPALHRRPRPGLRNLSFPVTFNPARPLSQPPPVVFCHLPKPRPNLSQAFSHSLHAALSCSLPPPKPSPLQSHTVTNTLPFPASLLLIHIAGRHSNKALNIQ